MREAIDEKALVPCPFCGGKAEIHPDDVGSGGQHVPPYHAGCPRQRCWIVFSDDDPKEAARLWNRRAAQERVSVEPVDGFDEVENAAGALEDMAAGLHLAWGYKSALNNCARILREAKRAGIEQGKRHTLEEVANALDDLAAAYSVTEFASEVPGIKRAAAAVRSEALSQEDRGMDTRPSGSEGGE